MSMGKRIECEPLDQTVLQFSCCMHFQFLLFAHFPAAFPNLELLQNQTKHKDGQGKGKSVGNAGLEFW